jgi:NADPH-dependent glutamate synthase beta subunit-like oxidoreductase/ferredoxin
VDKSELRHWYDDSVPCRSACPADTDIPGYLEAIYHDDYELAYNINFNDNFFPEILGRVCSRPCEKACRHSAGNNGDSVSICFSKRAAGKYSTTKKPRLRNTQKETNKNILIIGGGVAGLAAAAELRRHGHKVTIYEKHKSLGGMLNQGIPVFRLPRQIIEKEIKQIIDLGIKIKLNTSISNQNEIEQLAKQFDAVVCAMGTLKPNILDTQFKKNLYVEDGLDFLLRVNEKNEKYVGKNVIVIGGGYTSMDCARTAIRLGAKTVKTFYRRKEGDLEILPGELEELVNEKGKMIFSARPFNLVENDGRLKYIELVKTKTSNINSKLIDIPNSKFKIKTDHIILAIGQKQEIKIKNPSENIFYAGDFKLGASTLINAIGDAKKTAADVNKFLMKKNFYRENYSIHKKVKTNRSLEKNYIPITKMQLRDLSKRTFKAEVELGFNKAESKKEASRCYLCHYKFEINNNLCVLCDECLMVRPVNECIKEISSKTTDSDGRVEFNKIDPGNSHGIYHGELYIDPKVCVRCGECEKACPTGAISLTKVSKINAST